MPIKGKKGSRVRDIKKRKPKKAITGTMSAGKTIPKYGNRSLR